MKTWWLAGTHFHSDAKSGEALYPRHESFSPVERSESTYGNALAIEIAVPLLVTLFSLLGLLAVKAFYLKQRRLHGIHQVPILIKRLQETHQDFDKSPTLTINSTKNSNYFGTTGRNAKRDPRRISHTGFFVGLLGSPAWEANMERHMAEHRWHQHSGNHLHRHTWHPYPSTPLTARTYSPGRVSHTSPSIPGPSFDRFECPSIEEIQQADLLRRHRSLSMTTMRAFAKEAKRELVEMRSLEGTFNSWDNFSGTLGRNFLANAGTIISKDRVSQTPEITISVADDTNPQNASILLPSNSFRHDSEFPSAHTKTQRNSWTVSPCPSHSSFLSLVSTTHSKSSVIDYVLDIQSEEEAGLPSYPDEVYGHV